MAAGLALGLAGLGVARGHGDVAARALLRDGLGGAARLAGVGVAATVATGAGLLPAVSLGYSAGALLADGAFLAALRRRRWIGRTRERDPELRRGLRPYLALEALSQAGQWIDLWVLGFVAAPATVGVYAAARGIGRLLEMVAEAAGHRYLPVASAAWQRGGARALVAVHRHTQAFVLALTWPVVATCLALPEPLLTLVFGPAYAGGAAAVRIVALGVLLAALAGYGEKTAVAAGRPEEAWRARGVGLLVAGTLCAATAPAWGATGAALGWAAGMATQRWLLAWRLLALTGSSWPARRAVATLARAALPALATFLLVRGQPPLLALAAVAAAALVGSAWALAGAGAPPPVSA